MPTIGWVAWLGWKPSRPQKPRPSRRHSGTPRGDHQAACGRPLFVSPAGEGTGAVLDIRAIREKPEEIERALAEKGGAELVRAVVASDVERRRLIHESEELKAEHGRESQEMG